jgi:acyl carrier protein
MSGNTDDIRHRVKRVIFNVTRIAEERIGDTASFREDFGLDSLSMLEIGVDLDYEFKLGLPDLEQRLSELPTVDSVVNFIAERLRERNAAIA